MLEGQLRGHLHRASDLRNASTHSERSACNQVGHHIHSLMLLDARVHQETCYTSSVQRY